MVSKSKFYIFIFKFLYFHSILLYFYSSWYIYFGHARQLHLTLLLVFGFDGQEQSQTGHATHLHMICLLTDGFGGHEQSHSSGPGGDAEAVKMTHTPMTTVKITRNFILIALILFCFPNVENENILDFIHNLSSLIDSAEQTDNKIYVNIFYFTFKPWKVFK